MTDDATPAETNPEVEPELPAYVIENARSSRSRCKSCQKKIDQDVLRLGVLVDGRYGPGHMWHHLTCAARRMMDKVEEAYELEAWRNAKVPPDVDELPALDGLRKLEVEAEKKKKERKEIPYAERAPSGRAKCKHSGEVIPKDAFRIVLGKEVEFGGQTRTSPMNVLPRFVGEALDDPECGTPREGVLDAIRENSSDLSPQDLDDVLAEIGAIED